jgi:hypothetical protein
LALHTASARALCRSSSAGCLSAGVRWPVSVRGGCGIGSERVRDRATVPACPARPGQTDRSAVRSRDGALCGWPGPLQVPQWERLGQGVPIPASDSSDSGHKLVAICRCCYYLALQISRWTRHHASLSSPWNMLHATLAMISVCQSICKVHSLA